jgi:hypothetical protein
MVTEEFAIYLNYVRKLGFEETPDYDFLRELFAKVLKNNGDIEDGIYDWNLLNGMINLEFHIHPLLKRACFRRQRLAGDISTLRTGSSGPTSTASYTPRV